MSSLIGKMGHRPVINVLGGIRVQTSLQGMPKTIVYGRTRIAGNLVWYSDFVAVPVTSGKKGAGGGGSGKKGGGEYDYGAAIIIGLCQGPIQSLGAIWSTQGNLPVNETQETYTVPGGGGSYTATQAVTYLSDLGVTRGDSYSVIANDYGGPSSITLTGVQQTPMIYGSGLGHYNRTNSVDGTPCKYNFDAGDAGKTMTITYTFAPPLQSNNQPVDPITSVGFTFFNGALGQAVWSYLTTKHPSQAIPYSGLAYVATPEFDLGMSGTLPNLTFEVYGMLPFGSGAGDANPADVLYDLLTNTVYGCGIDASQIGSMTQYSNYCVANGLLMSPAIDSTRTAADWIKEILEATNSEIIETGGKLVVMPYGDTTVVANGVTFTPATNPIYDLTTDDFIRSGQQPAVQVERPTVQDAFNSVTIEYLDRGNAYNPTLVQAQDLQAIQNYKFRPEGTRQYHGFTGQAAAAKCAATVLARLVYIRNKFKFKLPQKYILLDPMDLVTLTVPELGMSQAPVRILSIDEQSDRTLDITAEEFPWGCSGPTLYPKQSQTPGGPNASAPPGSINAPIIFEALSRLNNQIGHTIWFGLSGSNPNWGGCRIWASLDGVSYMQVGTAIGRTVMGALTAGLASSPDPDTTHTLSVDVTESLGVLESYTSVETNTFVSLCYIGGANPELISYENATLTSAYHYDLATLLRRGVYGSTIGAHLTSDPFMLLNDQVEGWDYDVGLIGSTIHFKFTSFNQSGLVEENIADVTDYTFSCTGASIGLLTPAHSSYRPLTNPLTAHDAGSSATINIASFSMRVPGQADIPFGSGAVTALSYNTLYYVFFSDPGFLPLSSPTYLVSTTKEAAIDEAGYMFVGSIQTPRAGGADTAGNNDGGGGAQIGVTTVFNMSAADSIIIGNGTVTNPYNAIDGDDTTFATLQASSGGVGGLGQLVLFGPTGITQRFSKMTLKVRIAVPTNNALANGQGIGEADYAFDGGSHIWGSTTFVPFPGGGQSASPTTIGPTTFSVDIPQGTNLSQVAVSIFAQVGSAAVSGSCEVHVYDAWIEAEQ